MHDLGIENGTLVLETGPINANVYVTGGQVVSISTDKLAARETIDAAGTLVFPGAVDPHVHFNVPGFPERDDFLHGTSAAAAGGTTTVFEMPNSVPVTIDADSFELKKSIANETAVVDFGLYLALTPENLTKVDELVGLGPVGFKAFMSYSTTIKMLTDGQLFAGMRELAKVDGVIAVHCENQQVIETLTDELVSQGRVDPLAYAESRPPVSEWEAVRMAVDFAKVTGARLHVVHSSTAEGAQVVADARRDGFNISVETCPQYIFLSDTDLERLGPYAQCKPPLRDAGTVDQLWGFLRDGTINCLGSDHSAHTTDAKDAGLKSIWDSPAGLPGIQTMVPLFVGEAMRRDFNLARISEIIATTPAKLFGVYPKKGAIRIGSDADFFLFDPEAAWSPANESLLYKHRWSPYESMTSTGRVKRTIVRGNTVYLDGSPRGEITVEPGFGEFVPR